MRGVECRIFTVFFAVLVINFFPVVGHSKRIEGVQGIEVQLLEQQIAANPRRNDLRIKLSFILEKTGDFSRAIGVLQQALEHDQFERSDQRNQQRASIYLYLGWLMLRNQQLEDSLTNYQKATEIQPQYEAAWLGVQLVWMAKEKWRRSIRAGKQVLEINKSNYFAISRIAYARSKIGQNRRALKEYSNLLATYPYDPESHLGKAFALIALGRDKESKKHCQWARPSLYKDPRFKVCWEGKRSPRVSASIGAHGSYIHFVEPWNAKSGGAASASGAIGWGRGWSLWAGGSYSNIVLRYQRDDFWQIAPVLGANLQRARTTVGTALAWIFSADKITRNTPVVSLITRYDGNWLGGSMIATGSFYPEFSVGQIETKIHIASGRKVSGAVGPTVILVGSGSPRAPTQRQDGVLTQVSGHGEINWWAHQRLLLSLKGIGGYRSYAVEAAGLGIWTIGDRFVGSYQVGMSIGVGRKTFLDLQFQQQFGDQQSGRLRRFSILSGTVGFRIAL